MKFMLLKIYRVLSGLSTFDLYSVRFNFQQNIWNYGARKYSEERDCTNDNEKSSTFGTVEKNHVTIYSL